MREQSRAKINAVISNDDAVSAENRRGDVQKNEALKQA